MPHPILLIMLQARISQLRDPDTLAIMAAASITQLADLSGSSPRQVAEMVFEQLDHVYAPEDN